MARAAYGSERGRGAWAVFVAVLALAVCVFPIERRPAVRAANVAETEFSAERALAALRRVLDDAGPHPAGSAAHAAVRERLTAELTALGLEPEVQESFARGPGGRIALVRNVVARRGAPSGPAVLLAAHYDSVGAAPGVADDGSGVAALLEIAQALRAEPPKQSVILLFTDGEELGLIGASAFASEHRWRDDVRVVINLEARGTTGPSLMFQTTGPSSALIPPLSRAAVSPLASSLSDLVYKYMPNDTDLSVFGARGIPGYNFAFIGGLPRYHTPLDDFEHLDARSVQHHGEQALALLRELDREPLTAIEGGDAVYFDVLGLAIVGWQPWLGWTMAVATLLVALLLARRALGNGKVDVIELVSALLAAFAAFACALGGPWIAGWGLASLHGVPDPGAARPWTMRFACAALALASFALIASAPKRSRASFSSAWIGGLLVCGAGALLSTAFLPRASHLAVVPALVWCVAELALDPTKRPGASRTIAVLAVAAAQTLLWAPIAEATELGFGFRLPPIVAAPMAFALLALWPSFASASRDALRFAGAASIAAALAMLLVNAIGPAVTRDAPAWLNLRYILEGDSKSARYEASTFGGELPGEVSALGVFSPATTPPFPWLSLDPSMSVAPAPAWDVPLPELEVLERRETATGLEVRARLRSPRGATRLHLHLPEGVRIVSASLGSRAITTGFENLRTQLFFAVPAEGVEVVLAVPPGAAVRAHLLDQDWSLPSAMDELRRARPATSVPRSDGDVSVLGRSFEL